MEKTPVFVAGLILFWGIGFFASARAGTVNASGEKELLRAKERLENHIPDLRENGIPVPEEIYIDNALEAVVVSFEDCEPDLPWENSDYSTPVRRIIGWNVPVVFKELDTPELSLGSKSSIDALEKAYSKFSRLNIVSAAGLKESENVIYLEFEELNEQAIEKVRKKNEENLAIKLKEASFTTSLYIGKPTENVELLRDTQDKYITNVTMQELKEKVGEKAGSSWSTAWVSEQQKELVIGLEELKKSYIDRFREYIGENICIRFHPSEIVPISRTGGGGEGGEELPLVWIGLGMGVVIALIIEVTIRRKLQFDEKINFSRKNLSDP